jgi:hypothetical protein
LQVIKQVEEAPLEDCSHDIKPGPISGSHLFIQSGEIDNQKNSTKSTNLLDKNYPEYVEIPVQVIEIPVQDMC